MPEIPDQPKDQERNDEPMYVVVQFSAHATARFRRTVYYAQGHDTVQDAEELAEHRRLIAKAGGRHRDRYEVFELIKPGERESAYRAGREDEARSQATGYEPFVASGPVEQELDLTSEAFEEGRRAGREDAARRTQDLLAALVRMRDSWYRQPGWTDAADTLDVLIDAFSGEDPDTPEGRT